MRDDIFQRRYLRNNNPRGVFEFDENNSENKSADDMRSDSSLCEELCPQEDSDWSDVDTALNFRGYELTN